MSQLWKQWLKTVNRYPQKKIFIDTSLNQIITAQELTQRVEQLTETSLFQKIKEAEVAFCLPNGMDWLTLFLAIQKAGAIALPLDNTLSQSAQWNVAKQLGAHFLWQDHGLYDFKQIKFPKKNSCLIKLTSGTSGKVKKVYCSTQNMVADGQQIISTMKIKSSDINLGLIPFGHSYGLGNLIMPLILQGTPIVSAPTFLPAQIPQWIKQFQVTIFPSVPTIFQLLNELPSVRSLKPLRLVVSAGARLSCDVAQHFFKKFELKLHNFYGSSETGGICYDKTGLATLSGRSVGKPLDRVKVKIMPLERIQVKSRAVFNRVFLLHDLGRWNRWGELELLGRQQPLVNVGGKKINPQEIELLLRAEKNISEILTMPYQDKAREFFVVIVEGSCNEKEIWRFLYQKLPLWKMPKKIIVTPKMPRTVRGKLDVNQLKKLLRLM
ncbi:MAG: acyl--CoA ligase [Verrucomicrobiae bacterium]|nr:acyl--CoA ligase [Verrucomicrobiae bacterium]